MPPTYSAGSASVNIVPDFKNAQRRIGEWFAGMNDVKVDVNPNLDNTAMAKVHAQVAMHRPKLHIDVDHLHLSRSVAHAVESMTGVTEVAGKLSGIIGPTMFAGAIAGLGQMAIAATQAGGALAILPAAIAGVAAPIAAVTIGMQGMGDAFKSFAKGDAEETRKALENLSPAARQFVVEMHGMAGAWKELRLDVQEALFSRMGGAIHELAHATLPTLRTGLSGIAGAFGDVVSNMAGILGSTSGVRDFATTLENIRLTTVEWSRAIVPLTQAFIDLTTVGSTFLPGIIGLLTDGATKFAAWTAEARASGELAEMMSRGLSMIGDLVQLIISAGRVLLELFRPAIETGTELIHVVTDIFNSVADFLAMDTQQSSLQFFFATMTEAVAHVKPAILALTDAIVNTLLPGFAELMHVLAPIIDHFFVELAHLMHLLHPLFPALAEGVGALIMATEPLIGVLGQIVTLLLPVFADLMHGLAPIISNLTASVGKFATAVISEMQPSLDMMADAFVNLMAFGLELADTLAHLALGVFPSFMAIVEALLPLMAALLGIFGPLAITILTALTPAITALAEIIAMALVPIIHILTENTWLVVAAIAAWTIGMGVAAVAAAGGLINAINTMIVRLAIWIGSLHIVQGVTALWTAAQWLLNAALAANPIGIVILALVALGAALVVAWNSSETFREIVVGVFQKVAEIGVWLWESVLRPTWEALGAAWNALWTAGKWVVDNIIAPFVGFIQDVMTGMFRILVVAVYGPLRLAWEALWLAAQWVWENILRPTIEAIQTAMTWMWQNVLVPIWAAMQERWQQLLEAFRWVWENVLRPTWNAIETAAKWLWDTILAPIWSAMQTAWDGLMNAMRTVYDRIVAPMWGIISSAVEGVRAAFSTAVDGIKTAWDRIKAIAAAPINFVIRTVLRDGLFTAWNWVVDKLGLPGGWQIPLNATWLQGIAGYARGGLIQGYSPSPTADNIPLYGTAGEFVQPVHAVQNYGKDFMEAVRDGTFPKELAQYYATGGEIFALTKSVFPRAKLNSAYRPGDPGYHGRNMAADMGEVGFPGGAGRPYIAAMKRWWVDNQGKASEIIYNGIGNDRPNVKNGAAFPYSAAVQAQHRNHLHVAVAQALTAVRGIAGAMGGGTFEIDKPWWSDLWSTITGAKDWLTGKIGAVGQMVEKFGNSPLVGWVKEMPAKLVGGMWEKIKGSVTSLFDSLNEPNLPNTPGGAGVERWRDEVMQALGLLGLPGTHADITLRRMNQESGGNPRAINNWDINAKRGTPSKGLMQVIDPTFRAYRHPGLPNDIWDPIANIAASMRYAVSRYGSLPAAYNRRGGYDSGGWLPPGLNTIYNGTGRPEPVLTAAEHDSLMRWRTLDAAPGPTSLMGNVLINAREEKATEIVDELWHRLRVASRGGVHAVGADV